MEDETNLGEEFVRTDSLDIEKISSSETTSTPTGENHAQCAPSIPVDFIYYETTPNIKFSWEVLHWKLEVVDLS